MKVSLIPERRFRVITEAGRDLGLFTMKSRWQGMVHITRDDDGKDLIVDGPDSVQVLLNSILCSECTGMEVDVVRAHRALEAEVAKDSIHGQG